MKVYRDFKIYPKTTTEALVSLLSGHLPEGWVRDSGTETDARKGSDLQYYCFTPVNRSGIEVATMFLLEDDKGALYTCNIVPRTKSELSHNEYNAVIEDFISSVIQSIPPEQGRPEISYSGDLDLKALLGEEGLRLLEVFSKTANKSTGSSHPFDRKRWFEFICYIHSTRIDFEADLLGRYLTEIEKWSPEQASRLVIEYEFGLGLLNHWTND